ncbi:uncharacterized protein LOC118199819 [Stegodyphus dumicola]|uniref:uncharacterized protein LOC118199819 n=1 Tax=Stegodyphus dumicola TaxID=202533 RepID=UPI0015AB27B3|nr:uncharacterized protein LOC118199819 [Stegodyphus dumicola]
MITFYNLTKGGVDTVDEMCGTYSVSRKSCRWPLTIFFGLLNITGINSYTIYKFNSANNLSRRNYLKELAVDLVKEHLLERSKNASILQTIRTNSKRLLNLPDDRPVKFPKKSSFCHRCEECPKKSDRKTSSVCEECDKSLCKTHSLIICSNRLAKNGDKNYCDE